MTDEEISLARAKAIAEVIMGNNYLTFLKTYRTNPQLIRVSKEIMTVLIPMVEMKRVTYFGVKVIIDESLSPEGCELQWII